MPNTQLHPGFAVRNHRGTFRFSSGTRRRRNADQLREDMFDRQHGTRFIVVKAPHIEIIIRHQRGGFSGVHATATPHCDHPIMMAIAEASTDPLNLGVLRVGGDVRETINREPSRLERPLGSRNKRQVGGATIGHDQRVAHGQGLAMSCQFF